MTGKFVIVHGSVDPGTSTGLVNEPKESCIGTRRAET